MLFYHLQIGNALGKKFVGQIIADVGKSNPAVWIHVNPAGMLKSYEFVARHDNAGMVLPLRGMVPS